MNAKVFGITTRVVTFLLHYCSVFIKTWYMQCFFITARKTKFAKVMFSQVFVCTQEGSLSGGSLSSRVSLSGRPPHTVKSGRYESYWNAFLFNIML